jgi:hypothetical protein
MIRYVTGDVFSFLQEKVDNKEPYCVFPHVVNIHGAFGAGLALAIANKFPGCKESYLLAHSQIPEYALYGKVDYWHEGNFTFANMFAQTLGGKRPIYYNHLSRCMDDVADYVAESIDNDCPTQIITVKFGAGLARGDWKVIEALIHDCWIRKGIDVTICTPEE